MSITNNLERSYHLFIDQEDTLAFFRGLAEYADYVLTTSALKEVVEKHIAERNVINYPAASRRGMTRGWP